MRAKNEEQYKPKKSYPVEWKIDSYKATTFLFSSFEASNKKSEVTTGQRLFYDRNKPYQKNVPYIKEYKSVKEVEIPKAYIIPKGYWNVIDLLKSNNCKYTQLNKTPLLKSKVIKLQITKLLAKLMKVIIRTEIQN